jgi:Fe-Mn family superoxide dismutase
MRSGASQLFRQAIAMAGDASAGTSRGISTFKLPDLPYSPGALEPYISGHIMELHHSKHHATYVANLNKAMEQLAEAETKNDVAKMIALQDTIKFNGGGELPRWRRIPRCARPQGQAAAPTQRALP